MALSGLKVVEFAGLAPGPFAGLILADNGAQVIRVDRPSAPSTDVLCRGKKSVAINPKIPSGKAALTKLVAQADILIDPFRPGVMERLGLGPEVFLGNGTSPGLNGKLIYARMIGFPRTGPHKNMAGHDINYLALSGVLSILPGTPDKPSFPINLLADFAGGGLTCALGILLALVERGKSGRGQVVDTDMVSGSRYLSSFPLLGLLAQAPSMTMGGRGSRLLDGGAPFYNIYTCKDGLWMSVGCLEPAFFKAFLERFVKAVPPGFTLEGWTPTNDVQFNQDEWPRLKEYFTKGFAMRERDYWAGVFHGTDACALPVLTTEEAAALDLSPSSPFPSPHPRIISPQFSDLRPVGFDSLSLHPGAHTREVLTKLGLDSDQMEEMVREGAISFAKVRESKM